VTVKILIVDDSKAMRMIVTRTLRQAGFGDHEYVEAENGAEGLAKAQEIKPDLVLSDWNMPEMSGIEFLQALRAAGDSVRFGFVTSESTDAMRGLADASGALFLIAKPFTADTFAEALGGVLVA
jgi:two-component system chemotaxis response regulator CheY